MGKTELKIDADLLAQAAAAGVCAEEVVEGALREAVRRMDVEAAATRAAKWTKDNAEAIKAHRERIEQFGVFGEDLRTW